MKQTTIEHTIRNLVMAADDRDTEKVSPLLAEEFRIIFHHFPVSGNTTLIDKAGYLAMLAQGKAGGEQRTLCIDHMHVSGDIASALVTMESATKVFHTHYQLVKKGTDWLVISDMPKLTVKEVHDEK